VKPVNAGQIALPTDGYRATSDPDRTFINQQHEGRSGEQRPGPVMALPQNAAPGLIPAGAANSRRAAPAPAQAPPRTAQAKAAPAARPAPAPGFSF